MTQIPAYGTTISYHQGWDKVLQEWYYILDSNGAKIRSNICLCKATQTCECKCGVWNEWYDNFYELEDIY